MLFIFVLVWQMAINPWNKVGVEIDKKEKGKNEQK